MRAISIIAVLLLLVVNALALLPAATPFRAYLASGGMALSLVVMIAILVGGRPGLDDRGATAQAARPTPVPSRPNQADAEIVSFLAMLQARGRLVDFLMDDINAYGDAQVGAAARVVHTGCKAALLEHFRISPVRTESEGTTVQVAAGYSPDEYQNQRPSAVLGSACPPRLEDGHGEPTADTAGFDRPASRNRSGGGGTEIKGWASWCSEARSASRSI
jgi:Domain of unknown function (DUF2760)